MGEYLWGEGNVTPDEDKGDGGSGGKLTRRGKMSDWGVGGL